MCTDWVSVHLILMWAHLYVKNDNGMDLELCNLDQEAWARRRGRSAGATGGR
jgi:hypothetical protein